MRARARFRGDRRGRLVGVAEPVSRDRAAAAVRASGAQRLVLRGHQLLVSGLDYSPKGERLASAGLEGVVRVWALDLDDLVAIARRRGTRTFTAAECGQYLRGRGC